MERFIADGHMRMGGDGMIIETDECLLFKRKYHGGDGPSKEQWVIGMIEVEGKSHFIDDEEFFE